jgi:hypothetical protein
MRELMYRSLGIHWMGARMGPRTGLDDVEGTKILHLPGFELRPIDLRPVASHDTVCAIPANVLYYNIVYIR